MLCNYYDDFNFSADWITMPGAGTPNECLEFFTRFDAARESDGILRIAAESSYSLHVNGRFIGRGPVRGTWNINFFDAYDLNGVLRPGDNTIAVRVHSMNDPRSFNSHPAGCGMIAEIPGIIVSGTSWRVRRTPGWISTDILYTVQQGFKTEYDLDQADGRWFLGEDAASWMKAVIFRNEALAVKTLRPRGIPPMRHTRIIPRLLRSADAIPGELRDGENIADLLDRETLLPSSRVETVSDNVYRIAPGKENILLIFDFGRHCTGHFELTATVCGPGAELHVTTGEALWNGRVRSSFPGRPANAHYVDTFHLKPGKNHITNEFPARGGTMLQLSFRNAGGEITVDSPVWCDRRYAYQARSAFSCSDALLTGIWDSCAETVSACTTDTFEDCPWREHAFWVNDLLVENLTSSVLFGTSSIHRRSLELIFSQQYKSGWCPGVVPIEFDERSPRMILPAANFFLFTIMDDYYRASGDADTVRRYLPNLARILEAAEAKCDRDGLISPPHDSWNFFDWGYETNDFAFDGCRNSMLNSLYICAMKLYLRLCGVAGAEAPREELEKRISRIRGGLRKFIRPDDGLIVDPVRHVDMSTHTLSPTALTSELSLAFAFQSGVWDAEDEERFLSAILSGKYLAPELYLSGVVFEQLSRRGHAAEALDRIRRFWGPFIRSGLKTIPESGVHYPCRTGYWESGSFCHGFSTIPAAFFRSVILGIRDIDDGFRKFTFAPEPLDLEFASGGVTTPRGDVGVKWERRDRTVEAELVVPGGAVAELPTGEKFEAGTHHIAFEATR